MSYKSALTSKKGRMSFLFFVYLEMHLNLKIFKYVKVMYEKCLRYIDVGAGLDLVIYKNIRNTLYFALCKFTNILTFNHKSK